MFASSSWRGAKTKWPILAVHHSVSAVRIGTTPQSWRHAKAPLLLFLAGIKILFRPKSSIGSKIQKAIAWSTDDTCTCGNRPTTKSSLSHASVEHKIMFSKNWFFRGRFLECFSFYYYHEPRVHLYRRKDR